MSLSPKHARFIDEFIVDMNAAAAAKRSGYSPRSASALMANPAIKAEIARRQEAAAISSQVTLESLISECEQARQLAEQAGNASAMVSATQLKAKLTGRLIDDAEAREAREAAEREAKLRGELKTAAQLLSDAAVSMGLPPTATPAQIVGASAERPIATPEMFALLRAKQEATGA